MRIIEPLNKILNQEIKIRIIRFLLNTKAEWSGRQIAKEINVSPATCHKFLRELYAERILLLRSVGMTHLYCLNQKNYIVKNILSGLFQKEREIPDELSKIIKRAVDKHKKRIISVVLFGSAAKKTSKPLSDIDIMLVLKSANDKREIAQSIDDLNGKVIELFNSRIEPYILTQAELKTKKSLPIICEIRKTGELLMGAPLEELI